MENSLEINAQFLSYWHIGTGRGSGQNLDALVEKDSNGLPYIPGRTIKGLFRDAFFKLDQWQSKEQTDLLFGTRTNNGSNTRDETQPGLLRFSNLELSEKGYLIKQSSLIPHLYQALASTQIDEKTGSAKDQSLRMIEVVIPTNLTGTVSLLEPIGKSKHQLLQRQFIEQENIKELVTQAASLITHIGANKNRGFGRVALEVK